MAYYNYYRQHNPTMWGTQEYALDSPPAPRYQPQPQWRGGDYYRAHNDGMQDSSAFDYVWGRMKNHVIGGPSRREAQSWHKRVYGGLVDVASMMPTEIGAAAGYEAWRFFDHHRGIYRQPLMDDREREGEALVGLAVGEAEKLWAYTRRHGDKYGKREALETAAAVAMKLYSKGGSYPQGGRFETPGSRYETPGSRYETPGGRYGQEPYVMDDSRYPRPNYRSRRSSSGSPLSYDEREDFRRGYKSGGDYSDYERDREYGDYGRSPGMGTHRLGSPSVMSSVLPGVGIGGSYGRRRASSSSYQDRPHIGSSAFVPGYDGSALSTSPNIGGGALILPSSSSRHHHSSSFGGYHNGLPVHNVMPGDPSSEYSHLPPGTYMVTGGSGGRRKHRKSHSGVRYI
ncbi:hypothetical protein BDV93DRAFT_78558 [Ceratobasidium sp. AG-I]|nr:hypothetical protein BDV93DRAFT_78558 [Ceratobasidium sp. AG-I]